MQPAGDFSNDCIVDFDDVTILAEEWLRTDKQFNSIIDPGTDDLVGHWELDGDTADSTVYSNHGTVEGDYSWVDGYIGSGALELEGNASRVLVPDAPQLRPVAHVTLAAWVNYSDTHDYSARVVVKGADAGNRESYALQIDDENTLSFFVRDANTTMHSVDSNDALHRNEWTHVAGSYNGSEAKCYINGELAESDTEGAFAILVDTNDLAIGNRADSTNRAFIGTLDDVRVYDGALLDAEIAHIATDGSGLLPLMSQANLYNHPVKEPEGSRAVNFRDYAVLTGNWLTELKWPQ